MATIATFNFPLTPAQYEARKATLAGEGVVIAGTSGVVDYKGIEVAYEYDGAILTVTVEHKPWIIPESEINSNIANWFTPVVTPPSGLLALHQRVKLGKDVPPHDARTLKLASYLDVAALPPPPDSYRLPGIPDTTPTIWDNDRYGICTKAAYAGLIYSLSMAAGSLFIYSDDQVLKMYEDCDSFNPLDASTDNGSDGLTTLKFLSSSSDAAGHGPLYYAALELGNLNELRLACRYMGGVYTGIQLPAAWQGKTAWDVGPGGSLAGSFVPGSWGGHMIYKKAEYSPGAKPILTWKSTYQLTDAAWVAYVDEAWIVLSGDFKSPDGFAFDQLRADADSIRES